MKHSDDMKYKLFPTALLHRDLRLMVLLRLLECQDCRCLPPYTAILPPQVSVQNITIIKYKI